MKLGIIGMSEGNGHPYSWAAILNGYDAQAMQSCPFPAIPQYLNKQQYPDDFISGHQVSHIWTQDLGVSKHVAAASKIPHVVADYRDMIGAVDAVLLARDDAENHMQFATAFLDAGLPIYIDKPLATNVAAARQLLARQQFDWQIYSCSALRYATEMHLPVEQQAVIGELQWVEGTVAKKWQTYAVHLLEPIIAQYGPQQPGQAHRYTAGQVRGMLWQDAGVGYHMKTMGSLPTPLSLRYYGTAGVWEGTFQDSFGCFKRALQQFISGCEMRQRMIPLAETLSIVQLIEMGLE